MSVRIGVAGLGYWGPNLARNFAAIEGCELAWCCDGSAAARERWAPAFPGARFTGALDDLLADPDLDAVALALPVRAGRAPASVVARPAQGAAADRGGLAADGDVRRHGARAQADRLRQGVRRGGGLLRRVHHPVGRHLVAPGAEPRAAADRVRALRGMRARGARAAVGRRLRPARGAGARGAPGAARRDPEGAACRRMRRARTA